MPAPAVPLYGRESMNPAVVFVAFTASWCGPCKALHADFGEHPAISFVDVEQQPALVRQHNVNSFPTIIAMVDGKEVGRKVGYNGKRDMERWMKKMSATDLVGSLRAAYQDPFSTEYDPRHLLDMAADAIERLNREVSLLVAECQAMKDRCVNPILED